MFSSGPFKCITCGFVAYNRTTFILHIPQKVEVHDNTCVQCNEIMETQDEYKKHIDDRHGGQFMFKCAKPNCGNLFDTRKELRSHGNRIHRKAREKNSWKKKPESEKKAKTKGHNLVCDLCGNKTNCMSYHMKKYHINEKVKCPDCGDMFQNQVKLKSHMYYKHNETPCPECGKMFSQYNLIVHIQRKHISIYDRRHKCETCGKGFLQRGKLLEHMNVHTGAKPFKCKFCGNAFSNSSNCRAHEKSHLGIKRSK